MSKAITLTDQELESLPTEELARLIGLWRFPREVLTSAVKILGRRSNDPVLVRKTLGPLLDHPKRVVVDGVVEGLERHADDQLKAKIELVRRGNGAERPEKRAK